MSGGTGARRLGQTDSSQFEVQNTFEEKLTLNWEEQFQMTYLQDTTLQVEEDETPAKEDVKFNPGTSCLRLGLFHGAV